MNNPYYKISIVDDYDGDIEEYNRVESVDDFIRGASCDTKFIVEKLSDEEFEDTEG
mgnify:CR=1 FL=1